MATIEIYDVCNDYSVEFNESRTFYNAPELLRYLKAKHGVVKTAPIVKNDHGRLNLYGWNKYDELIIQVYER